MTGAVPAQRERDLVIARALTVDQIVELLEQHGALAKSCCEAQMYIDTIGAENRHLRCVIDALVAERNALQNDLAAAVGMQSGGIPVAIENENTRRAA